MSAVDASPSFLGALHRDIAHKRQRTRRAERDGIRRDDERPVVHARAIRRIRASALVRASVVRMRIRTIAANSAVKPAIVKPSGHRMLPAMLEPVRPIDGP